MLHQAIFEDERDLSDEERRYADYCQVSPQVDPRVVLQIILDELGARETSELLDYIASVGTTPYREQALAHMPDGQAIRLGRELAPLVARAYDDQVSMRLAMR